MLIGKCACFFLIVFLIMVWFTDNIPTVDQKLGDSSNYKAYLKRHGKTVDSSEFDHRLKTFNTNFDAFDNYETMTVGKTVLKLNKFADWWEYELLLGVTEFQSD